MNLFRTLLFWILLALVGALLAQVLMLDPGFVLVRYLGTEVETTLSGGLLMLAIALAALWLLWKLLSLPVRLWHSQRERNARARLTNGLDALHMGHYAQAESLLTLAAQDPQFEASARVAAARAASARGDAAAALAHLHAISDRFDVCRRLALADLAIAEGRPDDALAALAGLDSRSPRAAALRIQAEAATDRDGITHQASEPLMPPDVDPPLGHDRS